MTEKIDLNEDILDRIEKRLRGSGSWADYRGRKGPGHYYIARNKAGMIAISLCKESIKTIDSLTISDPEIKCFVCSLLSKRLEGEVMIIAEDKKTTA